MLLRIRTLARENPRYGYRRIRALLQREGWSVNLNRVHRLWRREGLEVPQIRRKRRRMGQSENGCVRHRSERPGPVWSYDFIHDQTADGRGLKMLPIVDEFTRECLTIEVERSLDATDVVSTLEYLFEVRGEPEFIRSDNGPEFIGGVQELAGRSWCEDVVHRPWEPLGERLQRDVRQPAEGRVAGPRGIRDAEGGEGDRGGPWPELQPPEAAQLAGVSDPCGVRSGPDQAGGRFAPPGRRRADPRPHTLINPGPEFGGRSGPM